MWLVLPLFVLLVFTFAAQADESNDLVYFCGEFISGRNYLGAGWLHALASLDESGMVFALDGGAPTWRQVFASGQVGWRFAGPGFAATFMSGAELDPNPHPIARADLWFEPTPQLMTQGSIEAATDWVSWRVAAGWRPDDQWPWLGPEAAASAGFPRLGLHATDLTLSNAIEARVSAGVSWREGRRAGPYLELSAWRRF
jgi:hypothetical protein